MNKIALIFLFFLIYFQGYAFAIANQEDSDSANIISPKEVTNEDVWIAIKPTKRKIQIDDELLLEYIIYYRLDIKLNGMVRNPEAENAKWEFIQGSKAKEEEVRIGGRKFIKSTFANLKVKFNKPGTYSIDPGAIEAVATLYDSEVPITLETRKLTVEVTE